MQSTSESKSRPGPGIALAALLVGAGAGTGGTALVYGSETGAGAKQRTDEEAIELIEKEWRELSTNLGFKFRVCEPTASEMQTLAGAAPGSVVQLPWLSMAFPGEGFAAKTDRVVKRGGVTVWRGDLEGCLFGEALFVMSAAGVAGFVQRDGVVYTAEPLTHGQTILTEVFHKSLPTHPAAVPAPPGPGIMVAEASATKKPKDPDYPIELLVLIPDCSPRVGSYCRGSTRALVEVFFEERMYDIFNRTFDEALATDVSFNVTLENIDYRPMGDSLGADLKWLQTKDTVAQRRDAAKADLVALLFDECELKYKAGGLSVLGVGQHVVVEIHSALAAFSLSHEIGHCMDMEHDIGNDPPSAAANYGHLMLRLKNGEPDGEPVGRTMMMGPHSWGMPRAPVFSHPAVDPVTGVRYGLQDSMPDTSSKMSKYYTANANNRAMIIKNAPAISHYRSGHPKTIK